MRISRLSCANSRIPSRHDRSPSPSPPLFSPHRRINAPLQVQPTMAIAVRKISQTLHFRSFPQSPSLLLTSTLISRGISLNQRVDAIMSRYQVAFCCTHSRESNHVTRYYLSRIRALPLTGHHSLPPIYPCHSPALLNFAHLLAQSQTQHETGTTLRYSINLERKMALYVYVQLMNRLVQG